MIELRKRCVLDVNFNFARAKGDPKDNGDNPEYDDEDGDELDQSSEKAASVAWLREGLFGGLRHGWRIEGRDLMEVES